MIERLKAVTGRDVPRETVDRLEAYACLLREENHRQNLVARSTLSELWERHLLDSAQLVRFAPRPDSSWVDIGSGAGLPGVVIALLTEGPVSLGERCAVIRYGLLDAAAVADFLERAATELGLGGRVTVVRAKAEAATGRFDLITGRAVAALRRFLGITLHLSHPGTVWVLPKGRSANIELEEARRSWHCSVRSEASFTDPQSRILVLGEVRAKVR